MDQHCTICHAFKATEHKTLLPTRTECLECHAAMQVKGEIFSDGVEGAEEEPMHWECGECHKPHGQLVLSPKDCVDCHGDDLQKIELHKVKTHTVCITCHKPHKWKITDPAPCLECHAKVAEHADGAMCTDCH